MAEQVKNNITIENARIFFKNFKGEERQYNPAGRRNFCVEIPTKLADKLVKDGWNVKERPPRDENDTPTPYLQVAVSFDNLPPLIKTVSQLTGRQTVLDDSTVEMLDWADISNVDLTIRPYNWEVNGKTGVKAYLKTMFVTIEEDELVAKYENISQDSVAEDDIPF